MSANAGVGVDDQLFLHVDDEPAAANCVGAQNNSNGCQVDRLRNWGLAVARARSEGEMRARVIGLGG